MVIDELIVRNGTTNTPVDSYDYQMIDEIVLDGNTYHFAKQKDLVGETSLTADNAVNEPLLSLRLSGNTFQQTYTGKNLLRVQPTRKSNAPFSSCSFLPKGTYVASLVMHEATQWRFTFTLYDLDGNLVTETGSITDEYNSLYYNSSNKCFQWGSNISSSKNIITTDNDYYVGFNFHLGNTTSSSYATEGQIEAGDTRTEYEPYVGGVASPNPEYPQEIQNAGNEGAELTLTGKNLYDWRTILKNAGGVEMSDGSIRVTPQQIYKLRWIPPDTTKPITLTVTMRNGQADGLSTTYPYIIYTDGTRQQWVKGNFKEYVTISQQSYADKVIDYVGWGYNYGSYTYIKEVLITYDIDGTYEPYFKETLEIPNSVTLADGTVVDLFFGKLGSAYTDLLTVDRLNNKVTYLANTNTVAFNGEEDWWERDANASEDVQSFSVNLKIPQAMYQANAMFAKCTHLKYNSDSAHGTQQGHYIGSWVVLVLPRSILIPYGFVVGTNNTYAPAFKAWLEEQYNNGTPVTIAYRVREPIKYDLTDTALGQSLLALATEKGTNIVEITSEIPVSQTDLSYWRQIIPNE